MNSQWADCFIEWIANKVANLHQLKNSQNKAIKHMIVFDGNGGGLNQIDTENIMNILFWTPF